MEQRIHDLFSGIRQDMHRNTPCDVPKFDGQDFSKWQKRMTFYLKEADLWGVVTNPVPAVADRTDIWVRQNNIALGTIFNQCHDEQ